MKHKVYFILAVFCALLAAGAVYVYLENVEQSVKRDVEYAEVIVSGDQIPSRTVITEDMLARDKVPLSQVREDAVTNEEEIVGSITRTPLYPEEQVIRPKLAAPGETGDGLAYQISSDKRAVAISVDEVIGVGNMVLPGDRVDVVAVQEREERGEEEERGVRTEASTVLQNLKVLAVGQTMQTDQTSLEAATVTLEAEPAEAEELVLTSETASIRLLLRGVEEDGSLAAASPDSED